MNWCRGTPEWVSFENVLISMLYLSIFLSFFAQRTVRSLVRYFQCALNFHTNYFQAFLFFSLYLFCNLNNVHRYGSVLGCGIEFFLTITKLPRISVSFFFSIFIFFGNKISVTIFQLNFSNYQMELCKNW